MKVDEKIMARGKERKKAKDKTKFPLFSKASAWKLQKGKIDYEWRERKPFKAKEKDDRKSSEVYSLGVEHKLSCHSSTPLLLFHCSSSKINISNLIQHSKGKEKKLNLSFSELHPLEGRRQKLFNRIISYSQVVCAFFWNRHFYRTKNGYYFSIVDVLSTFSGALFFAIW